MCILKDLFYSQLCDCVADVRVVWAWQLSCLWRPEGGVRSPGAGDYELPDLGTENQTLILSKYMLLTSDLSIHRS